MRIVHMTSVHLWNDTRIFHKMCCSLARAGHEVHLVAPGAEAAGAAEVAGVHLHSVPLPRNRWERWRNTTRQVAAIASRLQADVTQFHDVELIPAGLRLRRQGLHVVYDVHEDVPRDILDKDWLPGWTRPLASRLAGRWEASAARGLDGLIAATPAIAAKFPAHKTAIVRNYPVLGELNATGTRPFTDRPPVAVYVGELTALRGMRELVQAQALVPASCPTELVLAGRFDHLELEGELRRLAGDRAVHFPGWIDRPAVKTLLARACVGMLTLQRTRKYEESLPLKLFEYMSAGLPVIASDFPLWREIIESAGCGLLVEPSDPSAIARAWQWLLEHRDEAEAMGRRGQQTVYRCYHWESEAATLMAFYGRVVGGSVTLPSQPRWAA